MQVKGSMHAEARFKETFTRNDIKEHSRAGDKWIVIQGKVYDISSFMKMHPGGENIIGSYVSQDATDAWDAFHKDRGTASRFLKSLYLGDVQEDTETELESDYRKLRTNVEQAGLMTPDPLHFCWKIALVCGLEMLGYLVLSSYGYSWIPYFVAALCFLVSQIEAGWLRHDLGHMSMFGSTKFNRLAARVVTGYFKGSGISWWNTTHNEHHSRPNESMGEGEFVTDSALLNSIFGPKIHIVLTKDDISVGKRVYYSLILTLMGAARIVEASFNAMLKRQDLLELGLAMTFFSKVFLCLSPVLGGPAGALGMLLLVMNAECQWMFFVTYIGHSSGLTDVKRADSWITRQVGSSFNMNHNMLSDWLLGTHSYEIEHHLFPTMPEHKIPFIVPMVKTLCKKHCIAYKETTMGSAFLHCIRNMKKTNTDWMDYMIKGYIW